MRLVSGRRVIAGVAATVSFLVASGCGSESEGQAVAEPSRTIESSPTDAETSEPPSATPSETESADDQPVSDEMVQRLIAVANDAGYGPAEEDFAMFMVTVCREVQSGQSQWDELIAQDIADGAPESEAAKFNGFLRDEFCPAVKPPKETAQPEGDKEAVGDGTRGLGSQASFLDANWKHASLKRCRAAAGEPLGEARAYARAGSLVCADYIDGGVWGETFINLDVVFEPSVSEAQARKVALALLPRDASFTGRLKHTNPDWAAKEGSCIGLSFESSILSDAIEAANDAWPSTDTATATVYSTRQTDFGSGSHFDGSVRLMSLSIGEDMPGDAC